MREYTLVPSDTINKTDLVTVSTDPVYTEKANIARDKFRKNISNVDETLTPEIQLKLLHYFKKHLSEMNKQIKPLNSAVEPSASEKNMKTEGNDIKIIEQFLSPLPKHVSKLGNTLGQYLVSLKNITVDDNGFLSEEGFN